LLPKILEKLADFHDLHHLEIGTAQRMQKAHGLGEIIVLFLGIDEFIGIHNFLIVFPFSRALVCPLFIVINSFPILMKKEFICLEGIGPHRGQNNLICGRILKGLW